MCYSKFSGKPNEMLEGGGLVMDLDPILGKGGGRKKVMSGTPCHFMLKKQKISLSQMGHLA